MERVDKLLSALAGAVFLPLLGFMYGEGEIVLYMMLALAVFILLDWISGSRASKKDDSYASEYGIDGIFRTFFMILLPAGGHFLDMLFNLPTVLFGLLAGGLIYHTAQSMTANVIRAGWDRWIPEWMLNKMLSWVKSELDNKLQRSTKRLLDRNGEERKDVS